MAARWLVAVCVISINLSPACAPVTSFSNAPTRKGASPAAVATTAALPRPYSLLTQQAAATISGDAAVRNQALETLEPSGYVACIYTDINHEANSASVQIKSVPVDSDPSALREAATFFEGGEPSQPYTPFPVASIGESALGEAIPGSAFVVFATRDHLVFVGARSTVISASALRRGVEDLAAHVAAALETSTGNQP